MSGKTPYRSLRVQHENKVTTLWLDRPEKRNSLSNDMLSELKEFLLSVQKDDRTRVLVLRGSGKHFCSGADLNEMKPGDKTRDALIRDAVLFFDVYDLLFRLPVPTVCIAHGAVFGGGNGLVASADISIAATDCKFAFSEVRLGLVPATISPFVIARIGEFNARRLFTTGQIFDSERALRVNLVDEIAGESIIENRINDLTADITGAGPEAVRRTKKLVLDIMDKKLRSELKSMVTEEIAETRLSPEAIEGISAFFEKRDPNWK